MRKTKIQAAIDDLQLAQRALEDMPCGGVGHWGDCMADLEASEQDGTVFDCAEFQAQKAWLLIERGIAKVRA